MERTPVTSTTMSSVGYDPEESTLEIEFTTGEIYQYHDVPLEIYEGLLNAPSLGRYFNFVIKPLGFEFERL